MLNHLMQMDSVATLQAARRYLTTVLLNLPIQTTHTSVANLLVMLDHFCDYPAEYEELTNEYQRSSRL